MSELEQHRLEVLRILEVMDTPPEPYYDELVRLACEVCDVPVALITLVDEKRQWFKAKVGVDQTESPREIAFCNEAIKQNVPLVVNDATLDPRFKDNPLVTGVPFIRFYAGAPLALDDLNLGTLCVIDQKPRELNEKQIRVLSILASQAVSKMEAKHRESLRKEAEGLLAKQKLQIIASSKMSALGEMASGIAHEINNPLAVIVARAGQLLDMTANGTLDEKKVQDAARIIENTCQRIAKTVRALRTFARDDEYEPLESVKVEDIFNDTLDLCREKFKGEVSLRVRDEAPAARVKCHPVQICQVLLNLLSNSFDAVQDSPEKWVQLECLIKGADVELAVSDSGPGVPPDLRERVMEPFFTTKPVGKGTGIGLSICQRIVQGHGSQLFFDSQSERTRICFHLHR